MNHIRRSKSMALLVPCKSFDVAVFSALRDSAEPDRTAHFAPGSS
jgi:hypothetical protein